MEKTNLDMNYNQVITFWKEFEVPASLYRNIEIDLEIDFIKTITGPRRAGKTFLCFQLIKKLIQEGHLKENILYINFEDNALLGANSEDLE